MPAWFDHPAVRDAAARSDYGKILHAARAAAGLTQRQAAVELGCSHVTVSRYESGRQGMGDVGMLRHVARQMRIPARLFGLAPTAEGPDIVAALDDPEVRAMQRRNVLAGLVTSAVVLPAVRAANAPMITAMDSALFSTASAGEPVPLARAARVLASTREHFTSCRGRELAAALPDVIGLVKTSRDAAGHDERARFDGLLADAYVLGNELAIKLHENPTAWVMADRALAAAAASGDPRAMARAQWRTAISLRRSKHAASAARVITAAAQQLRAATELESPWDAGFYARMLCCAAYTDALAGHSSSAYAHLAHAREVVMEFPRSPFTFDAVDLYGISVARAVGDYGRAVGYSASIRIGALADVERRTRFWEDTAIARWGAGNVEGTYMALLAAERIAPQEVRYRPWSQRLTLNLLSSGKRVGLSGLREFAARNGVGALASV